MRYFLFTLFLSSFFGAAILFLSPYITAEIEPWDSISYYHPLALFVVGFLILLDRRATYETVFIGVVIGQILYMVCFLPVDSLIGVSILIIAFKSLLALVGVIVKALYLDISSLNR